MSCAPLFEDLGKDTRDFLYKDFTDQVKAEAHIPSHSPYLTGNVSLTRKEDGSVSCALAPTFKFSTAKLDLNLSTAAPNAKAAVEVKDTLPGTTVQFEATRDNLKSSLKFQNKFFSLSTSLDWMKTLGVAAVLAHQGFLGGASMEYHLKNRAVVPVTSSTATAAVIPEEPLVHDAVFFAGYTTPTFQSYAHFSKSSRVCGLSYLQRVTNKLTVGFEALKHPNKPAETGEAANPANIIVGVEYSPIPNVSLKTKVATNGTVGCAYIHKLSPTAKFVAAVDDITRGTQKFGFSLVLFDE
ncbi:hypothetical protein Pelo_7216 [Pelomyxa schiedti]|nr:hypothetical protein Pelo_7216 [Pelomyxa schiedti]